MSQLTTLQIPPGRAGAALTPQQKRFNTLIRQIEQARQTVSAWHDGIAMYRQANEQVLVPLRDELTATLRKWVLALDRVIGERNWTHKERETLRSILCDAAADLLEASSDDAALRELFSKHAGVDFDTERRELMLAVKDMTEVLTGLDLGDEPIESETDLFERMQQTMHEQMSAEAERSAERAHPSRKAGQRRREVEAQQAMHSVREIFRKLASALHPDRETDDSRRRAKTELMQQVNQAYAANDLLKLLELQLQIEQIDVAHIASASTQKLKHYNKVLAEQLAELNAEIEHIEMGFCFEFGSDPAMRLNPRKLGHVLEQSTRELRGLVAQQQGSIRMLADVAKTKRWLKRQRQLLLEADGDDPSFF